MTEITQLLQKIEAGDREASAELLPQVYDELRKLATHWMARESAGQTLQPTALVHEAYLKLVDQSEGGQWNSRGHFFGAAAEAMRRILVEAARRKQSVKRGGEFDQVPFDAVLNDLTMPVDRFLEFDESLHQLEAEDAEAAELVKLRFIAGLTMPECAEALDRPLRSTERLWTFARTWLYQRLRPDE